MRRPIRLLLGLVAAAAIALLGLVAPAAAQSDEELVLEGIDADNFPLVRAVVSGPAVTGDLDSAFTVVEDGEDVSADVIRLRGNDLNVVVALDVSGSMEGEPLALAKSAISDMLTTLPDDVPVSVVSFGQTVDLQSAFTVDRAATLASIEGLVAAGGTALFDGVDLGITQLERQGGTGALVVLADGADSASASSLADVEARFAGSDVAASFVALETQDFTADTFDAMAGASGGRVLTVAEASDFSTALQEVASGLSNSYEIRYRSGAEEATTSLQISLAADPANAVSTDFNHDVDRQYVPQIATETRTVESGGPLSSAIVPILAALFVSIGVVFLYFALRDSDGAVERREERVQDKEFRKEERRRRVSGMQEALEGFSAQMLEANDRGRTLDDTLDRAGLSVRSNEFVVAVGAVTIAALLVGVLLFGIPWFLVMLLVPVIGAPVGLKILIARRRKAFVTQLGDTLQLMVGSLTAGYGLGQTLDSVSRETESPTSEEFSRVVMETRLGRSLEDALDAMSVRIQAPDFDWVVDAIKIQASVGGDLAGILEQVGETIRARTRIKRQVDALTAEGKISALVLFCLPFGLGFFIFTSNPDYIDPLVSTRGGFFLLGIAGLMMLLGGLWLRKLVNPEF